jgi:hypothetical protein
MVVSIHFTANRCTNAFVLIGRNHTRVKEEPASPAKKRKAYLTSGSNPIGTLEPFDEADSPQGSSKRQKTGPTRIRFDSAAASSSTRPPPQGQPENRRGLPRPTKRSKARRMLRPTKMSKARRMLKWTSYLKCLRRNFTPLGGLVKRSRRRSTRTCKII